MIVVVDLLDAIARPEHLQQLFQRMLHHQKAGPVGREELAQPSFALLAPPGIKIENSRKIHQRFSPEVPKRSNCSRGRYRAASSNTSAKWP